MLKRNHQYYYTIVVFAVVISIDRVCSYTAQCRSASRGNCPGYHNRQRIQLNRFRQLDQIILRAHKTDDDNHNNNVLSFPRKAVKIYSDYASRLWEETNSDARRKIAEDKATAAIRRVQHLLKGEEYTDFSGVSVDARNNLLEACNTMLTATGHEDLVDMTSTSNTTSSSSSLQTASSKEKSDEKKDEKGKGVKKKKPRRSILFGATMGFAVACWVFSGSYIFTGLFTLMTVLGQLEYYRMVMNTGVYPGRRIAVIGASSMFLTALFAPDLHQICLPIFGLAAIIQFLASRKENPSIADIATTFTGMFYLGYVPSFWVRIRLIGAGREATRLAPLAGPLLAFLGRKAESLPTWMPKAVHLPVTTGAIFIFWTWLCLAFSDVGAYFVGRKFGKTKLGQIAPAAGATSPNKSVEGVIGGCAVSAILGMFGGWVQKWPLWALTGATHGILLGLLGLIGDLTASMLKRDAGLKDFGDLIPEHGGIMDRVDSFVWTAPYSWIVCGYVIPALKAIC